MTRPTFLVRLCALAVLGLAAFGPPVRAQSGGGTFAVISDIHFNPFDPPGLASTLVRSAPTTWPSAFATVGGQPMSGIGHDTNHALLTSSLAAFARTAAGVDFAIVPGDFLTHHFSVKTAAALGVEARSPAVLEMTVKTTLFVADALAAALGG